MDSTKAWATCRLGSICTILGGSQPPKEKFVFEPNSDYIRLIQIRDYKSDDHLTYIPKTLAKRFCSKTDVMIGRYGPPLFQVLRGIEGAYNVALMKAIPISEDLLLNDFLYFLLQNPPLRNFIINASERTVGQDGIRKDLLENYEIALPPLNEQRRIVARLETLLTHVEAAQSRLATIPRIVKRFRQSVLDAACSGRLTEDWRSERADSVWIRESTSHRLKDIARFIDYRGKTPRKTTEGIPLITAKNIRQGYLSAEPREYIAAEDYEPWMTRGIPRVGDVLITTEAPLGYVVCINWEFKFALAQRVICLQFDQTTALGAYASLAMQSPAFQKELFGEATGSMVAGIKASRLKELSLTFPTLEEQQEIVRRVEALFKTADALEARYRKAKAHVDKLTQSILAKAFRGELVSQDPDDEPASLLLDRVRNERLSLGKKRKRAHAHQS